MEQVNEIVERARQSLLNQTRATAASELSQPPDCPNCGDTGYVATAKGMAECECVREKRVLARLPERYRKASLLDFPKPVQDAMLEWLGQPGDGLMLSGGVGRGKTYLAAALTRTLLLIRHEAGFKRADKLYSEIRDGYRHDLGEQDVLRSYVAFDYLVLDDIGAGSLSDHERRILLMLLDDRLEKRKSTIVTSNWDLTQIAEKMDERIASRLASFEQFLLEGRDRRVPE